MKLISIWVALALAGSLLWGGSIWLWLVGICAGKFLIRLLLTITLAIAVYILTYALIIWAYPPLGNYTRNSIGRIERSLYSISFQKLNLFISKKSF